MKKQKIILRADGDSQNGLGHMFRLFALYEMLQQDFDCVFLTRADSTLSAIPTSYKYACIPVETTFENEVEWLAQHYSSAEYYLVLDGYQFRLSYQTAIKQKGYRLVYIDDLCEWPMLADVVINHAPSAANMKYSKESYTRLALGTEYALLRPTFLKLAKQNLPLHAKGNVFVAFGGADPLQLSQKVLSFIYQMPEVNQIHLVQGAAARGESGIEKYGDKVKYYSSLNEEQFAALMMACDVAILPTSTVLFEWCCTKHPVITGYYAANQEMAYHTFVEKKAVIGIGDFRELKEENLRSALQVCFRSDTTEMMEQQGRLFDGNQQERIIDVLKHL